MSKEKAKEYYTHKRGAKKLNCAQAVIAAFTEKFLLDENSVGLFASFGRGMAPGGVCGAYYAAKFIMGDDHGDDIKRCGDTFLSKAGSLKCKEIRQGKKLSCVGCVETASEFLEGVKGGRANILVEKTKDVISLERQVRIIAGSLILSGILLSIFVNPWFLAVSIFVSSGLIFAGVTDSCMMGVLLMKLPYNRNLYKVKSGGKTCTMG